MFSTFVDYSFVILYCEAGFENQDFRKKELKKTEAFLTLPSLFDK
jgi:hypothetical protein